MTAAGVDGIDLKAAGEKGIYVTNVRGYCTEEVATHALALLMALSQKTCSYDRMVKRGNWDYKAALPCGGLKEKTVGMIGYGKIGEAYAKKVQPLCRQVWVASSHADREELLREGLELKAQEEIIKQADYISSCAIDRRNQAYVLQRDISKNEILCLSDQCSTGRPGL